MPWVRRGAARRIRPEEREAEAITAAERTGAYLPDRMPVILEPPDWLAWLGEADGDPVALLRPPADGEARLRGYQPGGEQRAEQRGRAA